MLWCAIIWFTCVSLSSQNVNYDYYSNAWYVKIRFTSIMRTYYKDAMERSIAITPLRFMYEESPHYEMGYILGEIIERYRKVAEHAKKAWRYGSETLYDLTRHVEIEQKLFFEVYHLVNMMHEIPRKYEYVPEFRELHRVPDYSLILKQEMEARERERIRLKNKNKQQKLMKELKEMYIKHQVLLKEVDRRPKNKWWPIDYGWEIDWYW